MTNLVYKAFLGSLIKFNLKLPYFPVIIENKDEIGIILEYKEC